MKPVKNTKSKCQKYSKSIAICGFIVSILKMCKQTNPTKKKKATKTTVEKKCVELNTAAATNTNKCAKKKNWE